MDFQLIKVKRGYCPYCLLSAYVKKSWDNPIRSWNQKVKDGLTSEIVRDEINQFNLKKSEVTS